MKITKKVVISSLSTTMALSFVAALSGTMAWYQFNTRVSTTLLGTNVSESGVLQISTDHEDWKKDLVTGELVGDASIEEVAMTPVTFGALNNDGSLPATAYKKPEAAENWKEDTNDYTHNAHTPGSYQDVYQVADRNQDYIQYTVYIRAMDTSNNLLVRPVYLSSILMRDVTGSITNGLRVHISIDEESDDIVDRNLLISKNEVKGLALSGVLDVDGNGHADHVDGPQWNTHRNDLVRYGVDGQYQTTTGKDDIEIDRDLIGTVNAESIDKVVFTTSSTKYSTLTVTVWIEGWDTQVGKQDNVKMDKLMYREEVIHPVDAVDGLFELVGSNYVAQTGSALDGHTYVALHASELEIANYAAIPANTYELSEGNYNATADAVAQPGKHYYSLIDLNREVVKPADVTTQLSGLYELDNTNYVLTEDTVDEFAANPTKKYYSLINVGATYAAAPAEDFQDGVGDPLPTGAKSVVGYYTKDANDNYIPTSGMNVNGTQYYVLSNAGVANNVPMWNGENTDGAQFHFGLTFDVGSDAFKK